GTGGVGKFSADGSTQTSANFYTGNTSPIGVRQGLDGNMYVADNAGTQNAVRQYNFAAGGAPNAPNPFVTISGAQFIAFAAPEPGTLTLVALGSAAGALGYWRRRRSQPEGEAAPAEEAVTV